MRALFSTFNTSQLQSSSAAAELVGLVERLAQATGVPLPELGRSATATGAGSAVLASSGYARLADLEAPATCAGLVRLVEALDDVGLPPVFSYLHAAPLALGRDIQTQVNALLGRSYVLVDDVWAWLVRPGQSGWPPHRGVASLLDRAAPEVLNTWVALGDVPTDRSCMHFVPLDEDPFYPAALARVKALPSAHAVALPAGGALVWNANIAHWGGPCDVTATAPRVSCSFTLARSDALGLAGGAALGELAPLARVDLVARQIATYGEGQPLVSPELLAWARSTCALRDVVLRAAGGARKEG